MKMNEKKEIMCEGEEKKDDSMTEGIKREEYRSFKYKICIR